ncbi:MAG: M23 family metallopeptidase [Dysgonomonas sp.]
MKKYLVVISAVFLISTNIYSQYDSPLKIPVYLSANFGELRNNHFHSGIDIKTQGVINKPVYSVADGYISRISVSPSGYGLALYITHPETGQTSVYGHLESFIPSVEKYVKSKQYEQESFRVNLSPEKNEFPVKRGQLIAYSGNTGSSGGPHVHFEIRDTETEHPLDPLVYYTDIIKDNVPPDLRGIAVYPIAEKGVVNNSSTPLRQNVTKAKNGNYLPLKTDISAWGTIGIGVKAYDKMSATSNIYGVKIVRLYVDDNKVFESDINRYSFDETRALNSSSILKTGGITNLSL